MKNIIIFAFCLLGINQCCFATICDGHYENLGFYSAGISPKKEAYCHYEYCYYGCITHTTTLPGKYKPAGGSKWHNENDGGSVCESYNSGDCVFNPV